jgi:hypothetical protein
MHKASPTSAYMCELEPSVSTVPDVFIMGVGFMELPVSIKYLQEDIREFIDRHGRPSNSTTEHP